MLIDVLEMDKKDDVSLGKILKIDSSKYTDLDELLVSHIESIMSKTESIIANRKYKDSASDLRKYFDLQMLSFVGSYGSSKGQSFKTLQSVHYRSITGYADKGQA